VAVPIPIACPYTHCVYVKMVPGYLPWPKAVVMVSGVAGIILGIALRVPRSSRAAACEIIALLAAVFPSNVHMAASSGNISDSTRLVVVDAITVPGRSYRLGLSLYVLKNYSNE
jgi:uncharacterized membrane protein